MYHTTTIETAHMWWCAEWTTKSFKERQEQRSAEQKGYILARHTAVPPSSIYGMLSLMTTFYCARKIPDDETAYHN